MNLGILLRAPFQRLVEQIHADLAAAGYPEIRPAQGIVFQFIGKEGARLTTLAEKAQMTKQSMSYLVEYLEKEGHVEKIGDETDKRANIYRLTKKGWDVVAIAEQSIAAFESECREEMGDASYEQLLSLLTALNTSLSS